MIQSEQKRIFNCYELKKVLFFSQNKKFKMKKIVPKLVLTLFSVIMIALGIGSCTKSTREAFQFSDLEQTNNNNEVLNASKLHYNLDVKLRGENESSGHIKFRQDDDTPKIIILDTRVSDLEPNHSYLLQRAVDTNLDGNCTSTKWLTLGKGLTPQSILTDDEGSGKEELWRDVSSIASGATFDIHFQIIDAVTLAVVLTSDCYQYTVR